MLIHFSYWTCSWVLLSYFILVLQLLVLETIFFLCCSYEFVISKPLILFFMFRFFAFCSHCNIWMSYIHTAHLQFFFIVFLDIINWEHVSWIILICWRSCWRFNLSPHCYFGAALYLYCQTWFTVLTKNINIFYY